MNIHYDILFRVRILHEYYEHGFSNDFEFAPTSSCQALLNKLQWMFRTEKDGFLVLAKIKPKVANQAPELFHSIGNESLRLAFEMRLRNPYFQNITHLPNYPIGEKIFYFSNLRNDVVANNPPFLGDHIANARLGNPVPFASGFTKNLTFGQALQTATLEIKDIFENLKTPLHPLALTGNDETQHFQINLNQINQLYPGRYRVTWTGSGSNGNEVGTEDFIFEPKISIGSTFGMIELFNHTSDFSAQPAHAVPATHRFLVGDTLLRSGAQNDVLTADYRIQLPAHSPVHWHYVLVGNTNNTNSPALNSLNIANFSLTNTPDHIPILGSRVLRSNNPLAVQEKPPNLTLTTSINGYTPTLPIPSMSSNLKRINGQTPFYELYFYV